MAENNPPPPPENKGPVKVFYNMNESEADDDKPKTRWEELYAMVLFNNGAINCLYIK